jgi:NAD(P)-dependent dehydrogenase (short-subunit alcohol dehydrogenase family)
MDLGLNGKRALVTGATSGIGAACALLLAAEGVRVVVHGRNAERANAVAEQIRAAGGEAAIALGDVATEEGAEGAAQAALAHWGGVDILVNNAGGPTSPAGNWKQDAAVWTATFELNVLSAVRMVRRCTPGMRENRWGRIIQIASMSADRPGVGIPDYSMAKSTLPVLSVSLAKELSGTGITVNTVTPGLVVTQVLRGYFMSQPENAGKDWAEIEAGLARNWNSLVGGIAKPEDVAALVAFLASSLAWHITGANMRIDGGMTGAVF